MIEHGDTAYTNLPLDAHNDTTYFSDPVGLLFFHLLEHNGKGGESLFVDGFNVAEQLKKESKWAYDALSRIEYSAHSVGDKQTRIQPIRKFKLLTEFNNQMDQIRYNYNDRSILHLSNQDEELFYESLREWRRLVKKQNNEFWIQLTPGMAVMFNNWRVLHGRASFTGYRKLIGSYHNMDDFRSRVTTLLKVPERFDV